MREQRSENTRLRRLETRLRFSDIWSKRCYILLITLFLFVVDMPPTALAGIASQHFGFRQAVSPDPTMIFVIAFIGLIEMAWVLIVAFFLVSCGFHFIFFLSIGVFAVSAFGTGVFALSVIGISMANSVCDVDRSPDTCDIGLRKGLAVGCLRILLT